MDGRRSGWLCAAALRRRLLLAACSGESFSDAEKATIASMSLAALPPLPADPTNKYADDPAAAAFGATLFFDQRMSIDGVVACGTCHLIDRQFQDDLPRGTRRRRHQPPHHAARRRRLGAVVLLGRTPRQPVGAGADAAGGPAGACRLRAPSTRISSPRISTSATSASLGRCRICRPCRSMPGRLGTDAEKAAWAVDEPGAAGRGEPRLRQSRQGDCRIRALDRAGGDALRPFRRSAWPPATKPAGRRCADERRDRRAEALHRQGELLDLPHRSAADRRFFPQHRRSRRRRICPRISAARPARRRSPPIRSTAWANSATPGRRPAASCASW